MKLDCTRQNEYRYNFINKQTGRKTYTIQYCYGNIYQQIQERINNMKGFLFGWCVE